MKRPPIKWTITRSAVAARIFAQAMADGHAAFIVPNDRLKNVLEIVRIDDGIKSGTLCRHDGLSIEQRSIGGFVRDQQGAPQKIGLGGENDQLTEQYSNGQDIKDQRIPFTTALGGTIFGVSGSLFCAFFGGQRLYDQRKLLGSSLIGGACLLLALTLGCLINWNIVP